MVTSISEPLRVPQTKSGSVSFGVPGMVVGGLMDEDKDSRSLAGEAVLSTGKHTHTRTRTHASTNARTHAHSHASTHTSTLTHFHNHGRTHTQKHVRIHCHCRGMSTAMQSLHIH